MPLPSGVKAELEFTAGVWTDVTADVDWNRGYTITVGRTSPTQTPQTSTVSLTLQNPTGKYTPGVQVLSDGTTAPYYPNVQVRKRLRISNSSGVRFLGYVKSWSPQTNGFSGGSQCVVTASDRTDALSRVALLGAIEYEILKDTPLYYWPLTDSSGATTASEQSGNGNAALTIGALGSGGTLSFGSNGPGAGDGSGVNFAPTSSTVGMYLVGGDSIPPNTVTSVSIFINASAPPSGTVGVLAFPDSSFAIEILSNGHAQLSGFNIPAGVVTVAGTTNVCDGQWHEIAAYSGHSGIPSISAQLIVDGVQQATASPLQAPSGAVWVGRSNSGLFTGNIGQVALYTGQLTTARATVHMSAAAGWVGETSTQRLTRFLGVAGLTSSDWNLDTSAVTLGSYAQAGKDVLTACQDVTASEGGGSVFYVLAGTVQFRTRSYRKPGNPTLTIAAGADDDAAGYQPILDDTQLVNRAMVQRSTESGVGSTQIASNSASITAYLPFTSTVTSYTQSDADALHQAQWIVAAYANPAFRLPAVTVDLLTASDNLYAAVQATAIGSRVRITGLPAGQAPATQLDLYVEGWTETANANTYKVKFDTSAADVPAISMWDTLRWQANSDCALSGALTNNASTVVIACPTAPTFTTTPGAYPLTIQVDAEQITLTSAPSGGTSPQTFTGVTRGVNGTTAAAHSSGATVTLAPASCWAL